MNQWINAFKRQSAIGNPQSSIAIPLAPDSRSVFPAPSAQPPPADSCLPTPSRCLTNPQSKIANLKSEPPVSGASSAEFGFFELCGSLYQEGVAQSSAGSHGMIPRGGMPWVRKECEKPSLALSTGCAFIGNV
jgi:hypothetical protein